MGRKKIEMKPIVDKKGRKDTFHKRKVGLIKKATELSILCSVRMLLVFEDLSGEIIKYSTHGVYDPVQYFQDGFLNSKIAFTARHYPDFFKNVTTKIEMKEEDAESGGHNEYYDDSEDDENEGFIVTEQQPEMEVFLPNNKASENKLQSHFGMNLPAHLQASETSEKPKKTNYLYTQMQQQMQQAGYQNTKSNQRFPSQYQHPVNSMQWEKPQQNQQQTRENQYRPGLTYNTYSAGGHGNYPSAQYDRSYGTQLHYEKNMDLEVIEEGDSQYNVSSLGGISTIPQPEMSQIQNPQSKFVSFKKEFNPRLRVSEDVEESKRPVYPNNMLSPNLVPMSPIGFASISPITMNANSFIYEFNDSALINGRGINLAKTPMTGKELQDHWNQQRTGLQNPNLGSPVPEQQQQREAVRNPSNTSLNYGGEPEQEFLDNSDSFPKKLNNAIESPTLDSKIRGLFGFGALSGNEKARQKDEDMKNENSYDDKFAVPQSKGIDAQFLFDVSGMRLLAPTPLTGTQNNTSNADWLQYFYQKHSNNRSMQEEDSFNKGTNIGNDLSISIAKSPMVMKKLKDN